MREQALYIIKPEAFDRRDEIRAILENAGLCVLSMKTAVLPDWLLDRLYPELDDDLRDATRFYMQSQPSELGIVEGDNAIAILNGLTGDEVDPASCRPGTIRHLFGKLCGVHWGRRVYFLNGFHRSRTRQEAQTDIQWFGEL